MRKKSAVTSLLVLLAAGAHAQTQLDTFHLPGFFGDVGNEIGSAGDFDGDGALDALCVGPSVFAISSGATGAELIAGPVPTNLQALSAVTLPDIDGDGLRDVVLGDGVNARAVSSADGHVLWTQAGSPGGSIGWTLAVLNDIDGDSFPDVAVGEPGADPLGVTSAGSIWVLSGDSGALIHRIDGAVAQEQLGIGLDAGPDLNGDGRLDLFVADTQFKVAAVQVGRVRVVSALNGALLQSIPNNVQDFNFGRVLANAGDLDGDGLDDVAVSSGVALSGLKAYSSATGLFLWDDTTFPSALVSVGDLNGDRVPELASGFASFFLNASVRVLDGATGDFLGGFSDFGGQSFTDLAAMGDTDGDGLPELLGNRVGQLPYSNPIPAGLHFTLPTGTLLHAFTHPAGNDLLGLSVDGVGDTNGDGAPDWLVASSKRMVIFSGADGAALVDANPQLATVAAFFDIHAGCAVGDLDADGVTDVALANGNFASVGSSADGRVRTLSGATGASLAVRDGLQGSGDVFGGHLAATTDHDGDGVRDLYVTIAFADVNGFAAAGEVQLVSGTTLAPIVALHGLPQVQGNFGQSVDAGADLTGDGVPEVAIGSSEEWPGQFNTGSLYILDGATHATLYRKDGGINALGITGALTPDLNGDDVADFVSAEISYTVPGETQPRGRVRAWSGATGTFLWERTGPWLQSAFGTSICAAGDVNGDGFADVAATCKAQSPVANAGTLTLLSGTNGAILDQLGVDPASTQTIAQVRSAGHFDAGGSADVIVGVPGFNHDGGAFVYASSQGGVHGFVDLGFAKAGASGAVPSLRGYGNLAAGGLVTLTARHALPFKSCTWFVGLAQGNVPFKKGTLVPSPLGAFFAIPLVTDAAGSVTLSAPNPSSVFAGLTLYHQFWFADPAASAKVSASNGMAEIFK